jgi:hypothetical protein
LVVIRTAAVAATIITALAATSWAGVGARQEAVPLREARVVKTTAAPVIDGVLDDAVWEQSAMLTGFIQRIPYFGRPASEDMQVRLLRDDRNIYVGACMKQDPATIRRNKLRHRDAVYQDDTFEIVLDTFHDHRRAYDFLVNANGAKHDTQVDGVRDFNNEWNEVWDVRTSIQRDGWCAEFRIPVRGLRFQQGRDVWGVNVQRRIMAKQEYDYWVAMPVEYDVSNLSYAGDVSGFADLRPQRNLQAIPSIVSTRLDAGVHSQIDYGVEPSVDVKYVHGGNVTLDVTANTDFAQAEADDVQVNLTRFSLFFPEKRQFFLESAGIFDFGVERDTQVFFSRRIGIAEGKAVPILGGGRLTGKIGHYSVGAMSVQTREADVLASTNYTAVRGRRDLGGNSTVGAVLTNVVRDGYENRAVGVDANLWLFPVLQMKSFLAVTSGSDIEGGALSHYASLSYQTDPWGLNAAEKTVERDFRPGLGYVRRADIRELTGSMRRRYRLNRSWTRNIDFTPGVTYLTDLDDRLLTREQKLEITNVQPTGDKLSFTVSRQFEQLTDPFRITPDVTIPLDAYRFQRYLVRWTLDPSRRLSGGTSASWGGFYGGSLREFTASSALTVWRRLSVRPELAYSHVRLPQGHFSTSVARLRLDYNHNPNAGVSALVQWNSTTRELSANLLLRLIHGRDSDVFLVFNERRTDERRGWVPGEGAAIFKLTYRVYL